MWRCRINFPHSDATDHRFSNSRFLTNRNDLPGYHSNRCSCGAHRLRQPISIHSFRTEELAQG